MKEKKKVNGWKLTAIISLILNGLTALLLTIGLASPRSYVKASADFEYSYDSSKIITTPNSLDDSVDYKLYFDWATYEAPNSCYYFPNNNSNYAFSAVRLARYYPLGDSGISFTPIFEFLNTGSFNLRVYTTQYGTTTIYTYTQNDGLIRPVFGLNETFTNYNIHSHLRNVFDGSVSINDSNFSSWSGAFDLRLLKMYFSQYSVQNIQLTLKNGAYDLVRSIDFQSSFSFVNTMHQNYNYINNNLIRSTGRLFNINSNYDYGYMFCLDGLVNVDGGFYNGLCFVWKPVNLTDYFSSTFDGYVMTSVVANENNTFYYYLDSICPYGTPGYPVTEVYSWVRSEKPIVILHSDVVSTDEAFPPFTTEPTNTLKMTSSIVFTNSVATIHKLSMFPYTIIYEGWTYNLNSNPSINWSTFSLLFKCINHFYFNNGSVVITDHTQNDIENSTNNITGVFALISSAFESLIPLLSIMVLPNISLGLLLFIPLILTIILVVIKLVKR